jgi:hypothetical protein
MAIQTPPLTSTAPAQKTISFPGPLSADVVQSFRRLRVGTAGDVRYQCADGSVDTIFGARDGEHLDAAGMRIFEAGTTAEDLTLFL